MTNVKLMLWDLDGTLYPETRSIKDVFRHAVCDALRDVVDPALDDKQAYELIKTSRETYGDSFSGLIRQGFDPGVLHQAHHDRLDHSVIEPDPAVIAAFRRSHEQGIRHAILTHGHENWTLRVLEQAGLSEFFPRENIISNEKISFLKKHTGPEAFERALALLGEKPENTAMIEDKADNLNYPHAMGMKTIRVDYGRGTANTAKPDYIDRHCATPAEAIDAVIGPAPASRPAPGPGR